MASGHRTAASAGPALRWEAGAGGLRLTGETLMGETLMDEMLAGETLMGVAIAGADAALFDRPGVCGDGR
jgi:hypothetical protein